MFLYRRCCCSPRRWLLASNPLLHGQGRRLLSSSTAAAGGGDEARRLQRAAEIRRRETVMRFLRHLVIPAFTLYGLFILRPTEGHFLRYLAERRHMDAGFNSLFPPLVRTAAAPASPRQQAASKDTPAKQSTMSKEDALWMKRAFGTDKEDEERLARRRHLFARERTFNATSPEMGTESVKSADARREEREAAAEHPPMHLLGEQLNELAVLSRRHRDDVSTAPPPIEITFSDRTFFATAGVALHGPDGAVVKNMRFVGVCGMMWKEY